MIETIRLAFQGIWSHKMRSILTMLGIIIGIAAIITIVSTIQGTNEQIKENLIGAGNNVVTVQLNENGYPYDMSWSPIPDGVGIVSEETRQELEHILLMLRDQGEGTTFRYLKEHVLAGLPFPWEEAGEKE